MSMRARLPAIIAGAALLLAWQTASLAEDMSAMSASPFGMAMEEPIFIHVLADQLEGRFGGPGSSFRWSGEAWAGDDKNKLWLKSEGEAGAHGEISDGQQEIFYDRPISTYFDVQAGLRTDIDSSRGRTWAAIGVQGLAPYFFEVSATAYASDTGHYAAKLEASYDQLITQRLILEPQIEMNFYTKDDPARATGAGLADIDTGLRLRYEISRKFAPYIGLAYAGKFGTSRKFARASGDHADELRLAIGIRAWF